MKSNNDYYLSRKFFSRTQYEYQRIDIYKLPNLVTIHTCRFLTPTSLDRTESLDSPFLHVDIKWKIKTFSEKKTS